MIRRPNGRRAGAPRNGGEARARRGWTDLEDRRLILFGEAPTLPLQAAVPAQYQSQQTTYNGTPDPNWFTSYKDANLTPTYVRLYTQMDFVWAFFNAKPALTATP